MPDAAYPLLYAAALAPWVWLVWDVYAFFRADEEAPDVCA